MKHFFLFIFFLYFASSKSTAQFTNVLISTNYPTEPAICIDPNNTNFLVASTNIDKCYISNDGGVSWSEDTIDSSYGVWGDPSLLIDNDSNIYYFHLSNPNSFVGSFIDRIVCQKSIDSGLSFNNGSYCGLNDNKVQDKEWIQIDRTNGYIYVTWTEFDAYESSDPDDKSRILFSKSIDSGETWSTPKKINLIDGDCLDSDGTVEGAVPAVGPNGEIYVAWSGPAGIRFNKSTDYGNTWLSNPILIDTPPKGWEYLIPGIYRANGFPITVCDLSEGTNNGTIYVNWSDQRNGLDDTDIWLKKSTDGGNTWSDLIRVNNDDIGHQQFFTWMTIDQTTGYLYFVFYDRRNYSDNLTDVYLARSTDGGNSFINVKISEAPFLPQDNIFFGDYTNITAHDGVIRPIWTSLNDGDLKVWTALINESDFLGNEDFLNNSINLTQNYPNPVQNETYIPFKLIKSSKISLSISNIQGNLITKIIDNQMYNAGKHIVKISLDKYPLKQGIYFYTIENDKTSTTKKMIID